MFVAHEREDFSKRPLGSRQKNTQPWRLRGGLLDILTHKHSNTHTSTHIFQVITKEGAFCLKPATVTNWCLGLWRTATPPRLNSDLKDLQRNVSEGGRERTIEAKRGGLKDCLSSHTALLGDQHSWWVSVKTQASLFRQHYQKDLCLFASGPSRKEMKWSGSREKTSKKKKRRKTIYCLHRRASCTHRSLSCAISKALNRGKGEVKEK